MARSAWGAIRQLPSGRYQAKYRDDANRWNTAPDTFPTKADAQAWLARKRTDLARGVDIDDKAARRPLSDWWPAYEASIVRTMRPNTVSMYRSAWASLIEPELGRVAVGRIRPSMIGEWVGRMTDDGVSASRIRTASGLLGRLLDVAVTDRAITTNPARARTVRLPSQPRKERPVLEPDELAHLHRAACGADGKRRGTPALACIVSVLAWGGLRIGEALALQRHDVDLNAGTLTVRRSVADVDGRLHVSGTKTGKDRTVTLPASVVAELRAHLAGVPINGDAWLFPNRYGEVRHYSIFRQYTWLPMVERWNADRQARGLEPVQLRPHDLRSSCASLLIDAGASVKDVQQHLGHSNIATTLDIYARVRPGRADELAARMDAMLRGVQ